MLPGYEDRDCGPRGPFASIHLGGARPGSRSLRAAVAPPSGAADAAAGAPCRIEARSSAGGSGRGKQPRGKAGAGPAGSAGGQGSARFPGARRAAGFSIGAGGGAAAWFMGGGLAHASPLWPLRARGGGAPRKDTRTRVLILMSDTGGGHRASAEALRAGFQQLYGDRYRIDVVDLWTEHTPWPFNQLPKSYSFMVRYPFIWRANFVTTQPRLVHVPLATATAAVVGARIGAAYAAYDPDLVVSVHPLMQHVPLRVLRARVRAGLQAAATAFATVVTDLTTCHNTWFHAGVDRCYVATEETRAQALALGLAEAQVRLFGLPIRPAFARRFPPKRRLRGALGMHPAAPAVLLVGGGEGMGPVEATVEALAARVGAGCQLVVVCGRNQGLVDRLNAKRYPPGMRVLVKGFVDNMPDLMAACDAIITKAGPGTISEALICGLPMVLNAYVPCQEEGNIPYVTRNGAGEYQPGADAAAAVVARWLGGGQGELRAAAARAKALGRPGALLDICRDLAALAAPRERGRAAAA